MRFTWMIAAFSAAVMIAGGAGCGSSDAQRLESYEDEINSILPTESGIDRLQVVAADLLTMARDSNRSTFTRLEAARLHMSARIRACGIDFPKFFAALKFGDGDILNKLEESTEQVTLESLNEIRAGTNLIAQLSAALTANERTAHARLIEDLQFHRGFGHLVRAVLIGNEVALSGIGSFSTAADFEDACATLGSATNVSAGNYISEANAARVIFREIVGLSADNVFAKAADELIEVTGSDANKASLSASVSIGASDDLETTQVDPDGLGEALANGTTGGLADLCDRLSEPLQ